ncbi:MAG: ferritin family protein [Spirochaetaceae bacterium]
MKFNLNEVLDIAISIETSGYNFYTKAAKSFPEYADFFTFLAAEEIGHDLVFKNIKKTEADVLDNTWDPNGVISVYFDSLMGSTIFNNSNDINKQFDNVQKLSDVIDWAIKREHETILYFSGIKDSFNSLEDRNVIDKIISEEITHVHILMNKKNEL